MNIETTAMPTFYALGLKRKQEQLENPDFDKLEIPLKSIFDLHFDNLARLRCPIKINCKNRTAELLVALTTPHYDKSALSPQWISVIHATFLVKFAKGEKEELTCTQVHSVKLIRSDEDKTIEENWKSLDEFADGEDLGLVERKILNLFNNFPSRFLRLFDVSEFDLQHGVEQAVKVYESELQAYTLAEVVTDLSKPDEVQNFLLRSITLSNTNINDHYHEAAHKAIANALHQNDVPNFKINKITPIEKDELGVSLKLVKALDLDDFTEKLST